MVALTDEIVTTTKEHTRVPNEQSTECTEHEVLCSSLPLRKTESEYFQQSAITKASSFLHAQ